VGSRRAFESRPYEPLARIDSPIGVLPQISKELVIELSYIVAVARRRILWPCRHGADMKIT
jgi:hypothetical protein